MANISISQAAKDWGIARSTIQRRLRSGDLSATGKAGAAKTIDTSELLRVFGEPKNVALQEQSDSLLHLQNALIEQLKSENTFLREQVENLNKQLAEIRRPILPRLLPWMKE